MKRLWTGKTPREELVEFAANNVNIMHFATPPMSRMERAAEKMRQRMERQQIETAIAGVCDGYERAPAGSIKHAIGRYVAGLSSDALKRLVRDVAKARRHG